MSVILEKTEKLPKGWVKSILDDLITKISNGTTEKQSKEKTDYPVSRIETISNEIIDFNKVRYLKNTSKDIIDKYKIEKGDILFSNINSDIHLGKTAIFFDEQLLIHGMNLLLIRPNSNLVSPKFLNFYFKYYRILGKFISVAQHAVNQSSINQTKLKSMGFFIPSLNEQKRIVAKIEELFSKLDFSKQILEKTKTLLKQYRQSLLKSAFEGKLVPQDPNDEPVEILLEKIKQDKRKKWEKELKSKGKNPKKFKYEEPVPIETEGLPELPQGWVKTTLREITQNIQKINPKEQPNKKFQYCDINSIDNDRLLITDPKEFLGNDAPSRARQLIKKDDVLFSTVRTYLKNIALVPFNLDGQLASTGFCILRSYDQIVNRLIFLHVQSNEFLKHLNPIQRGTSYPAVRNDDVLDSVILLPPLNEQKKIVTKIEEGFSLIENNEKIIDLSLRNIEGLRKSVLKQAFEGKLVPQDPNDEPAEILLQKIKQEKQKIIKEATKRKRKKNDK